MVNEVGVSVCPGFSWFSIRELLLRPAVILNMDPSIALQMTRAVGRAKYEMEVGIMEQRHRSG